MGNHEEHTMRSNSLQAYANLDMSSREKMIAQAFKEHGPMTDRQVRDRLGYREMNSVRPRITMLLKNKILIEIDKARCPTTGITVRVCKIAKSFPERLWGAA